MICWRNWPQAAISCLLVAHALLARFQAREMSVSRTESRLGRVPQISLRGLRRPDLVRAAGLRCAERALGRGRRVMK